MTATIAWPYSLYSGEAGFHLVSSAIQPGQSLSGLRPVIGTTVQLWRFTMNMNTLNPNLVRTYRAALAQGRGPAQTYSISVRDAYEAKPTEQGLPGQTVVFHKSGVPFSSGAGYTHSGVPIAATCKKGDRSFRGDSLTRDFIQPGVYFGIGPDFHICTAVEGFQIHMEPAARRDHVKGLITLRPRITARLVDEEQGNDLYGDNRFIRPTLEWIEAPV